MLEGIQELPIGVEGVRSEQLAVERLTDQFSAVCGLRSSALYGLHCSSLFPLVVTTRPVNIKPPHGRDHSE